jgi:hypothetical protein
MLAPESAYEKQSSFGGCAVFAASILTFVLAHEALGDVVAEPAAASSCRLTIAANESG